MALSWSSRRQSLYFAVGAVIAVLLLLFLYESLFTAAPTCFDNKQNSDEHGVDCGGSCSLMCAAESRAPVVSWARAFETAPGTYTAAAYIQNGNPGGGAQNVPYSFQLFDDQNQLVVERDGITNIPPVQTVPIVETGITVGSRAVSRALFAFSSVPVWQKIPQTRLPVLRASNQQLAADGSRLSATINNDSLVDAPNVVVAAVLFDASGVARAASKSIVSVPRKSLQNVVFTWGTPAANIVRAEITILPAF